MARPLGTVQRVHVTLQMDAPLAERLRAYCAERGVSRTSVIELAVLRYLVDEASREKE